MNTRFIESICVLNGVPLNLHYHQQRMNACTDHFFGLQINLREAWEQRSISLIPSGKSKCRIVYSDHIESIAITPYILPNKKALRMVICDTIEYPFKFEDRHELNQLLSASGSDEILIIRKGLVSDTSFTNVVLESAEGLFTPASCLLKGTKRQQLLDSGIIQERDIRIADLSGYQNIRLINALIDLEDNIHFPVADILPCI